MGSVFLFTLVLLPRGVTGEPASATEGSGAHLAHDFILKSWNTENGLPHPTPRSLAQDADGFVWFGTFAGLARLDSSPTATAFSMESFAQSRTETCVALHSDTQGRLWIGTDSSIIIRENREWTVPHAPEGTKWGMVHGFAEGHDGTIYIGCSGRVLAAKKDRITELALPTRPSSDTSPWRPIVTASGQLWLRDDRSLWRREGTEWIPLTSRFADSGQVNGFVAAPQGGLWISEPHRLRLVKNDVIVREISYPSDFRDELVSVLEDRSGRVWVGGFVRGLLIAETNGSVRTISGREGLTKPHITGLLETREGVLFIGFGGGGALQLTPRRIHVKQGFAPDPWDSQITALAVSSSNQVFCSTARGSLIRLGQTEEVGATLASIPEPTQITTLQVGDRGDLWIGTEGGGVYKQSGSGTLEHFDFSFAGGKNIQTIHRDPHLALWFGTERGFAHYETGNIQIYGEQDHPELGGVQVFVDAPSGGVYAASGDTLFLCNTNGLRLIPLGNPIPPQVIVGMVTDPGGDGLWVTLRNGGIGWRQANGTLHYISPHAGAPAFRISSLICNHKQQIWGSSRYGLYRFDPNQLKAVALGKKPRITPFVITQQSGLLSDNCLAPSGNGSAISGEGRLWFASQKGVVVLDDKSFEIHAHPPLAHLLQAERDHHTVYPVGDLLSLPLGTRRVDVVFTSSSLAPPETIFYEYRSKGAGAESEWIPNGNSRIIPLDLPGAGTYRYEVRAYNSDGVTDPRSTTMTVSIPASIGEHWLVRYVVPSMTLLLVGLAASFAHRRRVASLQETIRAQNEKREIEETLRLVLSNTQAGLAYFDIDLRQKWSNQSFTDRFGSSLLEASCLRSANEPTSESTQEFLSCLEKARRGEVHRFEWSPANSPAQTHLVTFIPHLEPQGEVIGIFLSCIDITQLRADEAQKQHLEKQLKQSQKMEALGTMAGGIAHDFNNILTAIAGNTQLAMMDLPEDHEAQRSLREVRKAARRAAGLVKQILTFSRQGDHQRENILLRSTIQEAISFLRVGLPANIRIQTRFAPELQTTHADPTQIHQIVVNLATNSIHAMRRTGGTLTLEESIADLTSESRVSATGLNPGRYIRLLVSDSGVGMDRATLDKAFDPFFTTKSPNEGTGLGLAVVHGIMQRLGGAITVESQVGKGTTFELFFPSAEPIPPGTAQKQPATQLLPSLVTGHGQTVLLVDDDPALTILMERVLVRLDYKVVTFNRPRRALEYFKAHPEDIAALITDLSMPEMSGADLVRATREIYPQLPVILMTGYIRAEDQLAAEELGIQALLLKPGSLEEMSRLLAEVLHRSLSS